MAKEVEVKSVELDPTNIGNYDSTIANYLANDWQIGGVAPLGSGNVLWTFWREIPQDYKATAKT